MIDRGPGRALAALTLAVGAALATPTTNVWNPSTDVQAAGTEHLGIDNYFSIVRNRTSAVGFPTDVGLTVGLFDGFELGLDINQPATHPVLLNAKYGRPERGAWPAFAVGIQGLGVNKANNPNILYGLLSHTIGPAGRLTAGGYVGRQAMLGGENAGVILAWDKSFSDRWWASVDYASGQNVYGCLALGASYKFAPNVGLIVGYVFFNDSASNANDTFTTQLDIDF